MAGTKEKLRIGLIGCGGITTYHLAAYRNAGYNYDYEPTIRVQTRAHPAGQVLPVDTLQPPYQNPVQYLIDCIKTGAPISGPLSPAICRIGQQIVDSAILSAREKRAVALVQH